MTSDIPTVTQLTPFGPTDSTGQPMFAVNPGIPAEDALAQVSLLLGYAHATAYEIADSDATHDKAFARAVLPLITKAKALVDACV